ncbi:MAG TPA: hypothetical protein VFK10_17765, partial [Burkholderiaceae bacterium]|nr:hypothetical protein [Burkholderiaceae bacterium]
GYAGEGGFVSLSECIKDALLLRTGVLALWIDRTETREPEEWQAVPELALGQLIQPNAPGQRIEGLTIERDEEAEDAAEESAEPASEEATESASAEAGEEGAEDEDTERRLYRVSFTRVNVDKRLCLSAVPRENFVTSSLWERDPNRHRFIADRMVTTRARLVAEGFSAAKVKACHKHDPSSYEIHLRREDGSDTAGAANAAQDATETVEVWRCYPLLAESEGSSDTRRFRVYYNRAAKIILAKPEAVGRVCYGIGNTMLYPHRLDGVSLFDRIGEVQHIKTRALRDWIENSRKVNRPRLGVDESLANIADAKDATQDVIRIKGPNALIPVPVVDAGPSLLGLMEFMDRARSERGGASLDMQAASTQIAVNQTAQGIERQYSVKEQLAAMMARTFGETALRAAFQIAHYLLRTQWGSSLNVKVDGQWVEVDPSQWRPRNGVRVRIGQSESQRAKKVAALQNVIGLQAQAMGQGLDGILTDASRLYNAAYDLIAASMLPGPERYLIDPSSPQAKASAQGKQQQQQAAMQAQGDGMRAALMLDKYKADIKAWSDLIDTYVRAAIEEAKLTLQPAPLDEAEQLAAGGASAAVGQAQQSLEAGAPKGDQAPPGQAEQQAPAMAAGGGQ